MPPKTLFCIRKSKTTKSPNHFVAYKLQNTPHLEIKTPDVKISIKNKKYTAY